MFIFSAVILLGLCWQLLRAVASLLVLCLTIKNWQQLTAVMIIACPCALLLSNTLTNGNILRWLGRNRLYLRNAQTIETIAKVNHILFDKTGTLTTGHYGDIVYEGSRLTSSTKSKIASLAAQSKHPVSKATILYFKDEKNDCTVQACKETPGKGIEGLVDGDLISMGSKPFLLKDKKPDTQTSVYVAVEEKVSGCFRFQNHYRDGVQALIHQLKK